VTGVQTCALPILAWDNINVLSITLTPQEFNIVISRKDTIRTYNTLEKFIKTRETPNIKSE
jgi:hypothetical protein